MVYVLATLLLLGISLACVFKLVNHNTLMYIMSLSSSCFQHQDSPLGVRDTDFVTSFPAGITTASTYVLNMRFHLQLMHDHVGGTAL